MQYYDLTGIAEMTLNVPRQRAEVTGLDGRTESVQLSTPVTADIRSVIETRFSFITNLLSITLVGGHKVTVEVDTPGVSAASRRPVVYLDQCHWSALANCLYQPSRLAPWNEKPAKRLIEMARDNQIVLPLSAAHMVETTATFGAKRQDLAATMLEFSRGWQMRHPIALRQVELREVWAKRFGKPSPPTPDVFSLDVDILFSPDLRTVDPKHEAVEGLPENIGRLLHNLSWVAATYHTLMDPDRIEPGPGSRWAEFMMQIARDPQFFGLSRPKRRLAALGLTLTDVADEVDGVLRSLDLTPDILSSWMEQYLSVDLSSMPFLGLYADVLDHRLANRNSSWTTNDLWDMLFLCCAVPYAFATATEKPAAEYMRRSWRDRPGTPAVFDTLSELVAFLDTSLPATEKDERVQQIGQVYLGGIASSRVS